MPGRAKLQLLRDRYARALRVIGQDLADLFPESLTIEMSGDIFVARGCGRRAVAAPKMTAAARRFPAIWQKASRPSTQDEPSHSVFVRTYTPDAINRLDELGRAGRKGLAARPDLDSIAEKLRMIGRILDEKNGLLLNLSHDERTITLRYCDSQGEILSVDYSNLTLYKLQQQYYSGRCYQPGDAWQGVRR